MTIANILVHVEPGPGSEARLRYALSLAELFRAKLTGLSVLAPPTEIAFATMGDAQLYGAAIDAAKDSSAAARAQFDKVTEGGKVATKWCDAAGRPEEVVAAEAGCNDLVIVGRDERLELEDSFYRVSSAEIVLGCGRPVIVLPDAAPAAFRGDRILVGWRNTPEAARAVHDALPLLLRAQEVILAEIGDSERLPARYMASLDAVAEHLRGHGAPVTTRSIPADGSGAGAQMIALAIEAGADMIVAGGYGHSRFREWVLGGVTHTLLHDGDFPCLLSH
jgi:nucleotide-binding universal stress UspA family protein